MKTDREMLRALWEERQVNKVMLRFARSLDTGDWSAYLDCFTAPVNIDLLWIEGNAGVVDAQKPELAKDSQAVFSAQNMAAREPICPP